MSFGGPIVLYQFKHQLDLFLHRVTVLESVRTGAPVMPGNPPPVAPLHPVLLQFGDLTRRVAFEELLCVWSFLQESRRVPLSVPVARRVINSNRNHHNSISDQMPQRGPYQTIYSSEK